ncbi:DUF6382 domain-containing protein [Alkalihalobacillus sp. FSL R5-0424]
MGDSIYGLQYEFQQKNGRHMIVGEKGERRLQGDDLVPLQLKMMQSNQIPNLLPLSVEEVDFNVRLYFDVTAKQPLSEYLQQKSLSSHEFYHLFLSIINTLEQSKLYMLNEHQYVLQEDYIYIGKNLQHLYITYLPVQGLDKEETAADELKSLLLRIGKKVNGLQGTEFNHLSSYTEDVSFSFAGLKDLLLRQQQLRPQAGFVQGYNQHPDQGNGQPQYAQGQQQQPSSHQQQSGQAPYANTKQNPSTSSSEQKAKKTKKEKPAKAATGKKEPVITGRNRLYTAVFGLLAIVIVWQLLGLNYGGIAFLSSIGLSVVIVGAVIYLCFFYKKATGEKDEQPKKEVAAGREQQQYQQQPTNGGYASYNQSPSYNQTATPAFQTNPVTPQPQAMKTSAPASEPTIAAAAAPHAQEAQQPAATAVAEPVSSAPAEPSYGVDTSLLSDDTVLLEEDEEEVVEEVKTWPTLTIEREQGSEEITISESNFVIGRNPEAAQYVEESTGVSRMHVEFVRIENSYSVKDLGSKNGTKVNDQPLVPYKLHSLEVGDTIQIGKATYEFKWE